jgi:hypothetical protein
MSTTIIPGPNVFRAISGSLFSTAANWSRGFVPTGSDVAMIGDNCVIDITRTVGSLVVRPGFTASINTGLTVSVLDTINVLGHLSCSGNPTINVISRKNSINTLSPGSSLFFFSGSSYDQTIPGVTYNNVWIVGSSIKRLTGNTIISGSLNIRPGSNPNSTGGGFIDAYLYDLTVSGSTLVDLSGATFRKSGPGRLTFIGNITGTDGNGSRMDLIGNPIVEFRNGIVIQFYAANGFFDSGQGQWIFTTNNQNIEPRYANYNVRDTILISGSIDVTVLGGQARSPIILSGLTNGTNANSRLINSGSIYLNYAPSPIPMSTGVFIFNATPGSRLGFVFDGNYQLPYSSYAGLIIGGSGTKSFPAISSSVSASSLNFFAINGGSSILDISASNFYCGNVDISIGGSSLLKTGPGNVTIDGNVFIAGSTLDFRGGNPSVTLTGNLTNGANEIRGFFSGTGSWFFPSVTQSIAMPYLNLHWGGPLLISGTLRLDSLGIGYNNIISGSINGTNSSARIINSASLVFATSSSLSNSMTTGTLDLTFPGNSVVIGGNYSATTPARFNTFSNLSISGTGIKTLGTSSYISGSLTFGNTAIFELSSSNLFVNGTTNTGNGIVITRSGSGTTVFNGRVTQFDFGRIDFRQGNANVEFRNGVESRFQAFVFLGSGSAIFSTNDQSYLGYIVNTGDIIISGSIRLRNQSQLDINKAINGTVPSSILDNSGSIYFTSPAACNNSMLTGSFISASFPGSVLGFAFTGSYKIPFSSFRNLILNPGGIVTSPESKTLSGDTTIHENLSINRDTIDTENNNLSVLGTTFVSFGTGIKKSGSGSILLSGSVDLFDNGTIDFTSASNASLEMRGGIIRGTFGTSVLMGTSSVTYSINNQNVVACNANNQYGSILISGPITVGFGLQAGTFNIFGSLNGTDVNSRFFLSASSTTVYYSPQTPMQTGILNVSASAATFIYTSGSQNIKGGVYRNLTFLNGLKTLQGNVSVLGTFSTGSGATSGSINLNGFTLTNP